jgi:IS30 family transposase
MLSDEEREKILELKDEGCSISKIARTLNKDRKTVRAVLREEGEEEISGFLPTRTKEKEGDNMSVQNQVDASLQALESLHALRIAVDDVVKGYEDAVKIPTFREYSGKKLKALRGVQEVVSNLYEKFEAGSQLGASELREQYSKTLEARSSWDKFWSEKIEELIQVDEEERVFSIKAGLKKELIAFNVVLESLRFFLASGKG